MWNLWKGKEFAWKKPDIGILRVGPDQIEFDGKKRHVKIHGILQLTEEIQRYDRNYALLNIVIVFVMLMLELFYGRELLFKIVLVLICLLLWLSIWPFVVTAGRWLKVEYMENGKKKSLYVTSFFSIRKKSLWISEIKDIVKHEAN
jgi:hypothetical protein